MLFWAIGFGSDLVYRVVIGWRFDPVPNTTDKEINVQGYCRSIGNGEYNLNGKVSTLDNQIAMEFDIDLVKNSDGCRIIRCKLDDVQLGALAIRYFEMLSFV